MDVQKADVQGVPAFYAGGPGKQIGAIVFRVGQVDEPFLDRGTTHLIEHLALSGLDDVHYSYNGGTGLIETTFFARGSAEEVISFLNHVVRALADLPWARAEAEADVLKAEADQRQPSSFSNGMRALLGENHAGQLGSLELALDRLDLNAIDAWRRTYFTRQNAALWFSGPPPDIPSLDLSLLPDGQRLAVPPAQRLVPGHQHGLFGNYQSPAALTITERSYELSAGAALVGRRLNDRLRGDLGVAYGATVQLEPLSGTETTVILGTQAAYEKSDVVYEEAQEELSKFIYNGPTTEELAWFFDMFVRMSQDPDAGPAFATSAASNELVGRPNETDEQSAERIRALDPQAIADAVSRVRDTFVWMLPANTPIEDRRIASLVDEPGRCLKKATQHYWLSKEAQQGLDDPKRCVALVLADEGITIDYNANGAIPGGDDFSTILLEDLKAVMITTDGRWLFWSNRWRTMTIDPKQWSGGGERVVSRLEDTIPAQLIVREREDSTTARRERRAA